MLRPRSLSRVIRRAMRTFPAVVVTGPRQSGKTTLLTALYGRTHHLVSLEDPDVRFRAQEDPRAFLAAHPPPVFFDEIQYVPDLLAYIKSAIDRSRKPGQWLLSGSQHFPLMAGVSESLAGRAAILSLLPFSVAERVGHGARSRDPAAWLRVPRHASVRGRGASFADVMLRGSYPEIAMRRSVDRQLWCGSYLATYLERDVRNLATVGDLNQFERFLRLVAVRTGQLLNLSDLARDLGISVPTARRWLSILETGYQVLLLYPYHRNLGKRLVKSPKLYLTDTALATYLLGIHDQPSLLASPHLGALFETMIITDVWKRFLHAGTLPTLSYLRTRDGLEVDLVVEQGEQLHCFEVKATMTVTPAHATSLLRLRRELPNRVATTTIIARTTESFPLTRDVQVSRWEDALAG